MSLSQQSVSVSVMTSQQAPAANVLVNVAGLSFNQEVYIGTRFSGQGIFNVSVSSGNLPATVTIQFKSPVSLGPGTYTDTVTVYVCFDQACSQPVSNSPQAIQVQYTVTKSTFLVTSLSPSSAYAGTQAFTLTVNGSTFTQQSTVLWNGNTLTTTYVSSSQLTALIPVSDIAATGTATISVSDPTYGTTNTETFTINPSPLTITSLSPASINAGSPAFTLTVTGTGFSQSVVIWNGIAQQTTFVSATQVTAQIPAANVATPGSATVSVSDPIYGNSNSVMFTITLPPLALNSVSPSTVTVGGPSFALTVLGTAFTGTSTVEWNGTALVTTKISATELIAQVPASDISATGTASVTISDPNSPPGTTTAQIVTIAPPSKDAVAFQISPAHTGAVTFNSVSLPGSPIWSVDVGGTPSYALIADGEVIVTVQLTSGANASSEIVALNQATGKTIWGPILVAGDANATYDNGRVFVTYGQYNNTVAHLEALDANTGAIEWNISLSSDYNSPGVPTAVDGVLYIGASSTDNGFVYALDESTGNFLWTQVVGSGQGTIPAITADGVYVAQACLIYDFRPATGELIWNNSTGCTGGSSKMPVVANQFVYSPNSPTSYDGAVFNAETGVNNSSYVADSPPAFTSTMGYFLQSGTLRGVRLSSNTVQWNFTGDGHLVGSPIAVNQYVFIGSGLGNLYALDGATGQQVWTVSLGSAIDTSNYQPPFSGLAAGDGLLVVPSGTMVTAYTLSTNP